MRAILRRILALWRPHRWLALALAATLALKTVFTVVLALSIKLIIDRVTRGDTTGSAGGIILALVAGYLVSAGAAVAAAYLEAMAGARILFDVRAAAFEKLQRLSVAFHTRTPTGEILARFSTDVAELQHGVVKKPRQAVESLLALVLFLPVMVGLEWRLALFALVAVPLAVIAAERIVPEAADELDNEKRLVAEVLNEVDENLQAQPVIRAFGLTSRAHRRFRDRLERLRAGSIRASFRIQLLAAISEFAVTLAQLAVVGAGAVMALRGDLEAGAFAAFVALLGEFTWESTVIVGDVLPEITKAGSGIRRIDELLAAEQFGAENAGSEQPPVISEAIRFERVEFGYDDSEDRQLADVTLELPAAKRTVIVGPSGSGKSTLLSLLLRFYDPDSGRVLVDSVDVRDLDLEAYRARIGVVFQDTFLFNVTLGDNILLARPSAAGSEVMAAAEAAGLGDFIGGLPDGLDTVLGPSGRRLSGGQRQRIGIARAILRAPELLLLDEATSALDPVTEGEVNDTLIRLGRGRTVVSVTHRLRSATGADLVIVMRDGRPVEQGPFDRLRDGGGEFAAMWEKQSGFEISPDGRTGGITPERLQLIPLFAGVDPGVLQRLASSFVADHYTADENVFAEGDPADRFHIIARGVTEVIRGIAGEEVVVAHLQDGDFFGEMALLNEAPRNATVKAVTPTLTLSLDRVQFESFLESSPDAAEVVRTAAAERAREASFEA